jgi:hypothetical protein
LAFIIPQDVASGAELEQYLRSIDDIENKTGFDFMSNLSENVEKAIQSHIATELWSAESSPRSPVPPPDVAQFEIYRVEPVAEYISIRNVGSTTTHLGNWRISDEEGSYTFPSGTLVSAAETHPVCMDTYNPKHYTRGLYLNNADDCVKLYAPAENTPVDSHCW